MFTPRANFSVNISGSTYITNAVTSVGSNLITVTAVPDLRVYSLPAVSLGANFPVSITGTPIDVTMIALATACVANGGSARYDLVDINTGAKTGITTNASVTGLTNQPNQIAGNTATGLAMATRSTGVVVINNSTAAATAYTPAALSGQSSTCVCVRPETGTWLVGTSNNNILEINSSGTVVQTITLTALPNTGTAQTFNLTGIAYSAPNVVVVTARGLLYVYNWSTQTLVYQGPTMDGTTLTLAPAASGVSLINSAATIYNTGPAPITEFYFETLNPTYVQTFWEGFNQNIRSSCISTNTNNTLAVASINSSNFASNQVLTMGNVNKVLVDTRAQDPVGTDVAVRIIRLRDDGVGTASIEVDQSVSAGDTNLQATSSRNYIEIAIESGTKFDIREFQA